MNAVSARLVSSQILRRLSASAQPACACAVQSLPRNHCPAAGGVCELPVASRFRSLGRARC